ncbi:MAG: ABC transporter ATP-binding protein [bacterium]|nr:ABC transporter ATP-binding protein [bacterium]
MTSLTLEHVSKRFTRIDGQGTPVTAIDDVSLKLASGQVMAILGPSGSGKSTLLRLVAGLMQPDSGAILYDNVPLAQVPLQERGIGFVFQEGALIPHWESHRSVSFFLRLRRREAEVPERIQRIAKITGIGLDKLLARKPGQLSGGEQQRVSVARALTRDLKILLCDEPFANLDAKLRGEARVELRRLLNEFPVTTIYVTHDQIEAVALASRIGVMREGRFEQIGTYEQLHDSPVNLFVAGFIGTPSINTFRGEVRGGHWYGENFGGYPFRSDLPDGHPVTLAVRPAHIHLKAGGTPAVVDLIHPYLAEKFNLLEVWLAGERWSLTVPLDQPIEQGSTIYCEIDAAQALYFDTRTEQRIG